jgi:hypothetical protein
MGELVYGLLLVGTVAVVCGAAVGGLVWAVSRSRRASWAGAGVATFGLIGWFVVAVLRDGFPFY